jgi:hypothetical protein
MFGAWPRVHRSLGESSFVDERCLAHSVLAGSAAAMGLWGRSDERGVLVALGPGDWWGMPWTRRGHQDSVGPLDKIQVCATGHADVGHEAVGTAEGTP